MNLLSVANTRNRSNRLIIICCLVLATPFFFFGGPNQTSHPLFPAIWNLGHILYFAILTVLFRQVLSPLRVNSGPVKLLGYCFGVLVLGLVIEWTQAGLNRNPDWHDIWRNQLGAWLGWIMFGGRRNVARSLLGLLYLALAAEILLVGKVAWQDWKIQNQLPLLSGLETEADLKQWTGNVSLSQEYVAQGLFSLKVHLTTDRYSGTGSKQLPRNWSGYEKLAFELFNPEQEPLRLTFIIADKVHELEGYQYNDRFNKNLLVVTGWNHFEVQLEDIIKAPMNREMDLTNVFRFGLFASNLKQPRIFYLDNLRLE